jgi:hypothetical protein
VYEKELPEGDCIKPHGEFSHFGGFLVFFFKRIDLLTIFLLRISRIGLFRNVLALKCPPKQARKKDPSPK